MPFIFKRRGMLIVISAPSGGGKSSIVQGLLKRLDGLRYSISATSRAPRGDERDGREYFFHSREEFEKQIAQGAFLEHAEVHGNFYGTPRKAVEEALRAGQDVILDIDVQGALQIRDKMPDAVLVFVVPPSMEVLEERLRGRDTDPEDGIVLRLKNAVEEMKAWPYYDYVVVNRELDEAIEAVHEIIGAEQCRSRRLSIDIGEG